MSTERKGWIGVDLDGTLAHYDGWQGPEHIGEPVKVMVARVKKWLEEGQEVRIFTARVSAAVHHDNATPTEELQAADRVHIAISDWCEKHIGLRLPVTCVKDYAMREMWDDRAISVIPNKGVPTDTISAYHFRRLAEALGIVIGDGEAYGAVADRALRKVAIMRMNISQAVPQVDTARDAVNYASPEKLKEAGFQHLADDIRRARNALDRALPLLQAANI